jgi:hypothetical protein
MMTSTPAQSHIHAALHRCVKHVTGNAARAHIPEFESLFAECRSGMETDSEKMLGYLILKTLNRNVQSRSISDNLYLSRNGIAQIQLFNTLIRKFPFVQFSQQIANNMIVNAMRGKEAVTLIDIGIGQGTQVAAIIQLAKRLTTLKRLTVVGIEPFTDALKTAELMVLSKQDECAFALDFVAVHGFAEDTDFEAFRSYGGSIIVNASLALHHIQMDEARTETLARIKALNPEAFILTEPDVDHFETDLDRRFQNCYRHFLHIFRVIDTLDASQESKNELKLFFGREIEDILGKEEIQRFEKHEPAKRWATRLKACKFDLNNRYISFPLVTEADVHIQPHHDGYLGFSYQKENILAVFYAN